jgi:signal transduction histidine kinase
MFYRATEQSDGSGIGLYIVKNAVDKLGGQISVFSKLGEGTRFTIILPNRIQSVVSKASPFVIEPR